MPSAAVVQLGLRGVPVCGLRVWELRWRPKMRHNRSPKNNDCSRKKERLGGRGERATERKSERERLRERERERLRERGRERD